ncbi:hypothetical protein [Methylobacterium sp. E-045]|uniref:hypothetical protein n=1 Tax=Methylobacterium sp. E-045 TaxID=2836575 RepID=UPI001FB8F4B7|nr:hypothetical protein [Methylobacterium sp. E-045]
MFLIALGQNLKEKKGIDAELAAILMTHILKAVTTQNAVAQAKEAILKLAVERATPPKVEAING